MVTLSLQGLLKRRKAARQKASEERAAAREHRPSTAQAQQQHAQQKRSGTSSRQQWKGPALSTLVLSAGLSLLFASLICWTMIRYVPIAADFVFEQLKSVVDDQLGAQSSSKRKTVRNVMTAQDSKLRRAVKNSKPVDPLSRPHKPVLDEMGIATWHEFKPSRPGDGSSRRSAEREGGPRKPNLDEMGPGVESIPARGEPSQGPRSKLGRPGMRGGFKKKGR